MAVPHAFESNIETRTDASNGGHKGINGIGGYLGKGLKVDMVIVTQVKALWVMMENNDHLEDREMRDYKELLIRLM